MSLDIIIQTVKHEDQRYDTLGDYQSLDGITDVSLTPGKAIITVSDMCSWRSELLVAIHELIELSTACWINGIPDENIVAFDKANSLAIDPGSNPNAPYHTQHMLATFIESGLMPHFHITEEEHQFSMDFGYTVEEVDKGRYDG